MDRSFWQRVYGAFRSLGSSSQASSPGRRRAPGSRRIAMEPLEDRRLLAVFNVNSFLDTVDVNVGDGVAADASGNTTLRAAIMEANATSNADTISMPAGTYHLTRSGFGEEWAATGDLDVTEDLTIVGGRYGNDDHRRHIRAGSDL